MIEAAVASALQQFGRIDILVNNAGIQHVAPIEEFPIEKWDAIIGINLSAAFHAIRATVPGMKTRKWGRIINIASIAGKEGNPMLGPYSASKAALIGLTKSLAKEVVGKGDVTINAVSPATIITPLLDQLPQSTIDYMVSRIPLGRTGRTEEVAAVVHFLASAEASFTTGQCYDISGGRATY